MNRLEERVREDLHARAGSVKVSTGDPNRIRLRARRRRDLKYLAAAAAVAVLVGVVSVNALRMNDDDRPFIETPASSTTSPVSTTSGLMWQQIATPPDVTEVLDLWAMRDGGYAIRSGDEIWISGDGSSWTNTATVPEDIFTPDTETAVIDFGDGWIGIGNTEDGPFVVTSIDGNEWTTIPLPTPLDPADDLVTPDTIAVRLAANSQGVVVVGRTLVVPDIDAVVARFAPELIGQEFTAFVDMSSGFVEITTSTGEGDISIPVADIDVRLTDSYPMSAIVWHSKDASQWTQVETVEDRIPSALAASDDSFALLVTPIGLPKQVWTSPDGITWDLAGDEAPISTDLAFFNDDLFSTQGSSIFRMGSDGTWESAVNTEDFPDFGGWPLGPLRAGLYGIVAPAWNSSTEPTPVETLWFSPDAERWYAQELEDIFGGKGTVLVAVGPDGVVVGHDSSGQAFVELREPFEFWIGTLREERDSGAVATTVAVPDELERAGTDLQDEILADGRVTREEFERAVAAMATCMESHGLADVTWSVDTDGEGWSHGYAVTFGETADSAIENLCYYSYVYRLEL